MPMCNRKCSGQITDGATLYREGCFETVKVKGEFGTVFFVTHQPQAAALGLACLITGLTKSDCGRREKDIAAARLQLH